MVQFSELSIQRIRRDDDILVQELYSRFEIQRWALRNYEREIYDNIAQVLSLAKLQLLSLRPDDNKTVEVIRDSGRLVGKAIVDLRNLTRLLSPEEIIRKGFAMSICHELKRLTEAGLCRGVFSVKGNIYSLGDREELVAFSVLQNLIYSVLNIKKPVIIGLLIRFNKQEVTIEFEKEARGRSVLIKTGELMQLRARLKCINSSIRYRKKDKQIVQIIINK